MTSPALILSTSPILMPPRAISSSIKRSRRFLVLNIISSTKSFSRISQRCILGSLNNLRKIRVSQGLARVSSTVFLIKLKNALRSAYRNFFVACLVPSPSRFRNPMTSSEVMEFISRSPYSRLKMVSRIS